MNGAENSPSPEKNTSQLKKELDSLRTMFVTTVVVLIVFSGAVNLYLLSQVRTVNKELHREQKMVEDFKSKELPNINAFISKLQSFSKTHPDINPILAKYGLLPTTNSMFSPSK
jgi:hypothetical protein